MRLNFLWRPEAAKAAMVKTGLGVCRRTADFVAERARQYCPVDTGELLNSIIVIAPAGGSTFHVVATAAHAVYVEFGSVHGSTWVAPNPFLRKALADAVREFPAIAAGARLGAPGDGNSLQHLGVTLTK